MTIELQAIRLGEIVFIGHPFVLFNTIKKTVEHNIKEGKMFIIDLVNDFRGYVPTTDRYKLDGREGRGLSYAAYSVPFIRGDYCFKPKVGATLVEEMTTLIYDITAM